MDATAITSVFLLFLSHSRFLSLSLSSIKPFIHLIHNKYWLIETILYHHYPCTLLAIIDSNTVRTHSPLPIHSNICDVSHTNTNEYTLLTILYWLLVIAVFYFMASHFESELSFVLNMQWFLLSFRILYFHLDRKKTLDKKWDSRRFVVDS